MDRDRKLDFLSKSVTEIQNKLNEIDKLKLFSGIGEQLADFLFRLQNHTVRIAIVGVTSSGKSTFLNTVLERVFLPTGIPPSSGRQIVCCKDKNNHTFAEVIFTEESGRKTLKIATNIQYVLKKYGDERENPGNSKQVLEIRCHTGSWNLPENYVLIDTPGLAAYRHEEHEAITLQLVVPTVDAVIYLTTAKCESDARTLQYIDKVTAENKPLIVVQNKIDTIEEKLYRDFSKIKSKEQIRHEHYERVRSMLQKAAKPSVRNAPIVQISAKSRESVASLLEIVKEQIRSNEDCRVWRFAQQLKNIVTDLQKKITILLADRQERTEKTEELKNQIEQLNQQKNELETLFKSKMENLRKQVSQAGTLAASIIQSVCSGYSLQHPKGFTYDRSLPMISFFPSRTNIPSELKQQKSRLEQNLQKLPSTLNSAFQTVTAKLNELAKQLNIQEEQLYSRTFSVTSRNTVISDAVDYKIVHHAAKRVKQDGFWGGFKRFFTFGCCGYDEYDAYDEQVQFFSPEVFLNNVIKTANDNIPFMENALKTFSKNIHLALDVLNDCHQKMMQDFSSLSSSDQDALSESELKTLQKYTNAVTENLAEQFAGEIPVSNVRPTEMPIKDTMKKVACNPLTYSLHRLAVNMGFSMNARWMKMLCEKLGLRHARAQVFYWNTSEMEKFQINYLSSDNGMVSADLVDARKGIPSTGENQKYDLRFVLLDLGEVGFFERIFAESGIQQYLKKNPEIPIVWCMNSAIDLKDNLIEAFAEQIRLASSVLGNKKTFDFMSNDKDIYHSALLHGLYFELPEVVTEENRRDFLARYIKTFHLKGDRQSDLGNYITAYIELKHKHGGRNG